MFASNISKEHSFLYGKNTLNKYFIVITLFVICLSYIYINKFIYVITFGLCYITISKVLLNAKIDTYDFFIVLFLCSIYFVLFEIFDFQLINKDITIPLFIVMYNIIFRLSIELNIFIVINVVVISIIGSLMECNYIIDYVVGNFSYYIDIMMIAFLQIVLLSKIKSINLSLRRN